MSKTQKEPRPPPIREASVWLLDDVSNDLRTLVISELRAEEVAARFPDAKVLREVTVWEEQPHLSIQDYASLTSRDRRSLAARTDADGTHRIYKKIILVDLLLLGPPSACGKAQILRAELQQVGRHDHPHRGHAELANALSQICCAETAGRRLRWERTGHLDLPDPIDAASAERAENVVVGPEGVKEFDESLGILANDLKRLMESLVSENRKKAKLL